MNESAPPPAPAETPAERAEKAAIRRRWISLAEWVGIAALLVSAAISGCSESDSQPNPLVLNVPGQAVGRWTQLANLATSHQYSAGVALRGKIGRAHV